MSEREMYIETLKWRLSELKEEIMVHQKNIRELFKQVESKQEQIKSITQLLAAEDLLIDDSDLAELVDASIEDLTYELLRSDPDRKPYHYKVITKNLLSQGVLIPGKDPAANLLSHISRDERFVRTASGTYGLVEDGHKPAPKRKSKRKR